MFGHGVTITLLREQVSGVDEYGNDLLTAVELDVPGCALWPVDSNGSGGNERNFAADIVPSGYTVLCPTGTVVQATDRVRLPDDPTTWDVVGRPAEWQSPFTGSRSGVQITLQVIR